MTASVTTASLTVALIGNPNTGKSTLFNALAGVHQRVGNYPGVTVEKKVGHMSCQGRQIRLVDLPGTYSLAPRSPDEMVAVDVLLGRRSDSPRVDAVLCIVDASNLERNLYLVSQVLSLGLPTVVALNMMDVARQHALEIDVERLSRQLGVPVVPLEAHRGRGIEALKSALAGVRDQKIERGDPFPPAFQSEVALLESALYARGGNGASRPGGDRRLPRYLVERMLLDTTGYLADLLHRDADSGLDAELLAARRRLLALGYPVPAVEAMARYGWVAQVLSGVVRRPDQRRLTLSDRIDRVLTHRLWGTAIFVLVMLAMFQSVFVGAVPAMDGIDRMMRLAAAAVGGLLPQGAMQSLLVDGVMAGFGSVLVFLPQIMILFLFIAVLEDCGYMARAAFLMDRLMSRVGLSGKSFIPLLSSFACAVPGIMATRVIEDRRDRLTTILVAPLMSCSARLPVYTVLIAAFIPRRFYLGALSLQGMTLAAMYLLGIATAVGVSVVLKRTLLRGPTPPFVMELPSYKVPSAKTVFYRMVERGWAFVRRAGTLIVAVSIVVWALLYYPRAGDEAKRPLIQRRDAIASRLSLASPDSPQRAKLAEALRGVENELDGLQERQSALGRMGRFIEPAVRPLGWDWRIGCAALASFPAREVVVATLGVIYNLGSNLDVEAEGDRTQLADALARATWDDTSQPVFNIPVALSIMVFFALCAQCAATLAVIKRETNSWTWPAFTFGYMTALAYLAALATYQVGMRIG
jgi:ferrous iron transport protein B